MSRLLKIGKEALPVAVMVGLVPLVTDDYVLAVVYVLIIAGLLIRRYEKHDFVALGFGVVLMTLGEILFVSTGIESFSRTSLFGIMPLWLPILWGYGFVAIKRIDRILS